MLKWDLLHKNPGQQVPSAPHPDRAPRVGCGANSAMADAVSAAQRAAEQCAWAQYYAEQMQLASQQMAANAAQAAAPAKGPSSKALATLKCIEADCPVGYEGSVLAEVQDLPDRSQTACPSTCLCAESKCALQLPDCLADVTCAQPAGLRRVRRVRCQDWLGRLRLEDSQQQSPGLSEVP